MDWTSALAGKGSVDSALRLSAVILLFVWALMEGSVLDRPYPHSLVELYSIPFTRLLLLVILVLSAIWCPTVGILAATSYILLASDLNFFLR
jgi:fumarate reductase subunit D